MCLQSMQPSTFAGLGNAFHRLPYFDKSCVELTDPTPLARPRAYFSARRSCMTPPCHACHLASSATAKRMTVFMLLFGLHSTYTVLCWML